jgi:hypothetical protein
MYVACHYADAGQSRRRFIINTPAKLHQLQELRAKVAALEESLAGTKRAELAGLPAKYGYASARDFVSAFLEASGKRRGQKSGRAAPATRAGKKRRTRAKITDETRAMVKKMAGGGKTGAEIAKAVGISLPSVQNIKKALGLTKKK